MSKTSFFSKLTGIKKDDDEKEEEIDLNTSQDAKPKESTQSSTSQKNDEGNWVPHNYEGQLSVDVYQTEDEIVIKSAVAGVEPNDLDISISNDMITIRGERHQDEIVPRENFFYQECYWGSFSRSIILPQEVDVGRAVAEFKKGILTIRLPKAIHAHTIKIRVQDED